MGFVYSKLAIIGAVLLLSGCNSTSPIFSDPIDEGAVRASRSFAGPSQFPPQNFAAYGILAFPNDPKFSEAQAKRFGLFCTAFAGGISTVSEIIENENVPIEAQMVTVLPLKTNAISAEAKTLDDNAACALAGANYGTTQARSAIRDANRARDRTDGVGQLTGRGPFLIAWSPGTTQGNTDAIVLVADLTNSESKSQIDADIRLWVDTIQQKPGLWRRGWNREGLRLAAQRWVDRRAAGILKIMGG